jgi:NADH-quinone oxidoreductase subunit N
LVGTPPTAVFLGKLAIFTAAVDGEFAWLAVVAILNTVASVFYYLRWLAPVFRDGGTVRDVAPLPAGVAYGCAAGSLVLPLLAGAPLS